MSAVGAVGQDTRESPKFPTRTQADCRQRRCGEARKLSVMRSDEARLALDFVVSGLRVRRN